MAKIVYGVSGEGSGHSSRAREMIKHLEQLGHTIKVVSYDRTDRDGSLVYKNFSKVGFLEDLASCKAVMATAGFTLMMESFYLRKPYLALPMRGQFE